MVITEDRKEKIKEQLAANREEAAGTLLRELERAPPRPLGKGYVSIEYRVLGAVAYYMGDGQIILYPLQLTEEPEGLRASIRIQLGAENWDAWEGLQAEVNSHLNAVSGLWRGIEESLAIEARRAGLFPSSAPAEAPVDTYWPALFVATIWREPEYYNTNRTHAWENIRVAEETVMVPMRHTVDATRTFIFEGTNMLRSQSVESVEMMEKAWEGEAKRVEPIQRELATLRTKIEARLAEFKAALDRL